jgi:hypothetical protein
VSAKGWVDEDPREDTNLWRSGCPCGWKGDARSDPIEARAELLVHRHDEHGEPL